MGFPCLGLFGQIYWGSSLGKGLFSILSYWARCFLKSHLHFRWTVERIQRKLRKRSGAFGLWDFIPLPARFKHPIFIYIFIQMRKQFFTVLSNEALLIKKDLVNHKWQKLEEYTFEEFKIRIPGTYLCSAFVSEDSLPKNFVDYFAQ